MDQNMERKLLIVQFKDYEKILHEKGLGNEIPNDGEVESLSNSDLEIWIRKLKDLARTT